MLLKLLRKCYEGVLCNLIILFYFILPGYLRAILVGVILTAPVSTRQDTKDDSLIKTQDLMAALFSLRGSV